jgi:hypothetical protein
LSATSKDVLPKGYHVEVRVGFVGIADLMTMISWLFSGFIRITYSVSASLSEANTNFYPSSIHNINIAYKTNNTIGKHLMNRKNNGSNSDRYGKRGIYRLKCSSCPGSYIRQIGHSFKVQSTKSISMISNIIDKKQTVRYTF